MRRLGDSNREWRPASWAPSPCPPPPWYDPEGEVGYDPERAPEPHVIIIPMRDDPED